jgi:hypothetical protein
MKNIENDWKFSTTTWSEQAFKGNVIVYDNHIGARCKTDHDT